MDLQRCVLAAVDLSEISATVVQSAYQVARRLGKPLLVVHSIEALSGDEMSGPLLPYLRRRVEQTLSDERESLRGLADGLGLAAAEGVAWETLQGAAEVRVPAVARSRSASLVVLGAPHPVLGLDSSFDKLARRCSSPILVCHHGLTRGYENVVVGVDLSPNSACAWNAAVAIAEPGARFTACHAENREAPQDRETALRTWLAERPRGLDAAVKAGRGPARSVLPEIAASESADLLAVGRTGHGRLREFLMGSTARALAHHAPCDVLIAEGSDGQSAQ